MSGSLVSAYLRKIQRYHRGTKMGGPRVVPRWPPARNTPVRALNSHAHIERRRYVGSVDEIDAVLGEVERPGGLRTRIDKALERAEANGYVDVLRPLIVREVRKRAGGGRARIQRAEWEAWEKAGLPMPPKPSGRKRRRRSLTRQRLGYCANCQKNDERLLRIGYCPRCGSWVDDDGKSITPPPGLTDDPGEAAVEPPEGP